MNVASLALAFLCVLASSAQARGIETWLVRVDLHTFTARAAIDIGSSRWSVPGCHAVWSHRPVQIARDRFVEIAGLSAAASVDGCAGTKDETLVVIRDGTRSLLVAIALLEGRVRWSRADLPALSRWVAWVDGQWLVLSADRLTWLDPASGRTLRASSPLAAPPIERGDRRWSVAVPSETRPAAFAEENVRLREERRGRKKRLVVVRVPRADRTGPMQLAQAGDELWLVRETTVLD